MHHPTDRIILVVEDWLEREIAQWVHPMKDRSDDPSHHERTLLPRSYISLPALGCHSFIHSFFLSFIHFYIHSFIHYCCMPLISRYIRLMFVLFVYFLLSFVYFFLLCVCMCVGWEGGGVGVVVLFLVFFLLCMCVCLNK